MTARSIGLALLTAAAVGLGCGDDAAIGSTGGGEAGEGGRGGGTSSGGTAQGSTGPTSGVGGGGGRGDLVFVADPPAGGPSIALEPDPSDPDVIRVVSRDLPPLYGVAFRVRYAPGALELTEILASDGWPEGHVALGQEAEPGLFFGVVSARGPFSGLEGDRELGRIRVETAPTNATDVDLDPTRCAVMAPDGTPTEGVTWIGGRFTRP